MRILSLKMTRRLQNFCMSGWNKSNFAVQVVSNGAEAQQLASDQAYDLVILESQSAGACGLTSCAKFAPKGRICRWLS